jgi:hypothetical protein
LTKTLVYPFQKELVYPTSITGSEPTLVSLQWNDSTNLLFGIIAANPYLDGDDLCYFVTINPVNFEIVYSGISLTRKVLFYFYK